VPIHVLPTSLVNKIAAGEVIERPASIVKELVENSLDAGATRIDIAVEDGGRRLITVTDDGCGMGQVDLALAFAPHATSKIADEDDLYDIATMGFRGEALASVAAVSHASIRSATRAAGGPAISGFEIRASGEQTEPVRPCAAPPGTTVTVRDLFFNTPARRKFLRSANTEFGHISEQLARLALPHPHVAFTLAHNGRPVTSLSAVESTAKRVGDLFGEEVAEGLLPIAARSGPVGINGLIAAPAAARSSARWQYFFLNGRYIRDRILSHALREAYRGLVDPSRFPAAFVFISLAGGDVDVNVHPTKIEVRFRDGQLVHGELLAALRETLNRSDLTPAASLAAPADQTPQDDEMEKRRSSLRQALADFFRSAAPRQGRLEFAPRGGPHARTGAADRDGSYVPEGIEAEQVAVIAPLTPPGLPRPAGTDGEQAALQPAPLHMPSLAQPPAAPPPPLAQAIQVHNAYIVATDDDGLLIIDQHALHERLIYNDLRRRLAAGHLTGQRMLIPTPLPVTPAEADVLTRFEDLLARLGIEVAPFGPESWAVQRFPSLLAQRGVEPAAFCRELLDKLAEDESADTERLLEELLEMLACKAAVKAGQPLTAEEMAALLARRAEAEKASACPHGRPTTIKLTLRELEKQFKRS